MKVYDTFHYYFDIFRDKIDNCTKNRCPLIYKLLIKCKDYEYYSLRRIISFPIGLFIGNLFFWMIDYRFDFDDKIRSVLKYLIISMVSLTYTVSVEMRAICWLIIPTFSGRSGRSLLIAVIITGLAEGPITNSLENSGHLIKSIVCNYRVGYSGLKEKIKLIHEPFLQIVNNFASKPINTSQLNKGLNRLNNKISKMYKINGNGNVEENDKTFNATQFMSDMNNTNSLTENCGKEFDKSKDKCENADPADHVYSWKYVAAKVIPMETIKKAIKLQNFCDQMTQWKGNCDAMNSGNDSFKLLKDLQKLNSDDIELHPEIVAPKLPLNMSSISEIQDRIEDAFTQMKWFSKLLFELFKKLLVAIFLWVFLSARNYHNKYLKNIGFDNIYITSYFRRIDARRKQANKTTLLPLKRIERLELVDPIDYKLSKSEYSYAKSSLTLYLIFLLIILIILFMDQIIRDLNYFLNKHIYTKISQTGAHNMNPKVGGSGFVAKYVRDILSRLVFSTQIYSEFDNKECLPKYSETESIDWIWYYLFGSVALNFIEMYFLRFRRIICGYFYPIRAKKRILHLYNDRLKKRKGYLKYLTHEVKKKYKNLIKNDIGIKESYEYGILDNVGLKFISKYIKMFMSLFASKKCLICEEKLGKHFNECPNNDCKISYCDLCWNECHQNCLICKPTQTYDESDFSDND